MQPVRQDQSDNHWSERLGVELGSPDALGIYHIGFSVSEAYDFHQRYTKGAHLRRLEAVPFHQSQWESPYYRKTLDRFLESADLTQAMTLDFGCGDGRFADYLLQRGAQQIVCVDFDYATLAAFSEHLTETGNRQKVLLLHTDFDHLPFAANSFDAILAIGSLYYLDQQYETGIARLRDMLGPNGVLITSDPSIEGFMLRALVFNGLSDSLEIFRTRRFREVTDASAPGFRAFDDSEWREIFRAAGLAVLDRQGISLFHNLLRVLFLKGLVPEGQLKERQTEVEEMFDYLHDHGSLFKHVVWKLGKDE